jgi:hypothetical protein
MIVAQSNPNSEHPLISESTHITRRIQLGKRIGDPTTNKDKLLLNLEMMEILLILSRESFYCVPEGGINVGKVRVSHTCATYKRP